MVVGTSQSLGVSMVISFLLENLLQVWGTSFDVGIQQMISVSP